MHAPDPTALHAAPLSPSSCGCCRVWNARRAFVLAAIAGAALPAAAQVDVGGASRLRSLVPAEKLEVSATQQYHQLLEQARAKRALAPEGHPQLVQLHMWCL